MLIELGKYVEPEVVIDLNYPGLVVSLADGDKEARMAIARSTLFETATSQTEGSRSYSLLPTRRPVLDGITPIWQWVAHYYWVLPGSRKAYITLARTSKTSYRLELEVCRFSAQYVLDKGTNTLLDAARIASSP
jgi:hypothetical protein